MYFSYRPCSECRWTITLPEMPAAHIKNVLTLHDERGYVAKCYFRTACGLPLIAAGLPGKADRNNIPVRSKSINCRKPQAFPGTKQGQYSPRNSSRSIFPFRLTGRNGFRQTPYPAVFQSPKTASTPVPPKPLQTSRLQASFPALPK